MAVPERGYWPQDIDVDTLTPREILEMQAKLLSEVTKGLVVAEVTESSESKNQTVLLELNLVAPNLGYRRQILTVRYTSELFFPAFVDADCFRGKHLGDI